MREGTLAAFRESRFGLALLSASLPFLLDSLFLLFTAGTFLPEQLSIVYMASFGAEALLLLYAILTRRRRAWWDFLVLASMMVLTLILAFYSLAQGISMDTGFRAFAVEGGTAVGWDVRETIVTSGFFIRTYVLVPMENAAQDASHPLVLVLKDGEASFDLAQVGYFISGAGTLAFFLLLVLDSLRLLPGRRKGEGEEEEA